MTASPVLQVAGATSTAPDGTTLLDGVSFTVERGWLVAVVGPTGAGKSSLAKALLGQLNLTSGTVRVTGRGEERGHSGRVAGVPQEDATHPQLSLRRTLEHAAALRVGATPGKRSQSVDAVLTELGLTGRAGTRLCDLSGGERKRANVAVELVGRPDLLVLDEPTAGLDPGFEKSVFANLRALADTGRTIVAITHSVRVLAVCDRVLFLAPGGVVAFFGTPAEAEEYFAWDDPADAYAALSTEPAASWKARFAAHQTRPTGGPVRSRLRLAAEHHRVETGGPAHGQAASWGGRRPSQQVPAALEDDHRDGTGHLRTLLHRAVHVASSDRRTLGLSLAAGPLLGLLLWGVLPSGTLGPPPGADMESGAPRAAVFAFFLAMTVTWLAAAGAAREVVKERHILRRELGVGVSLTTYLTGKALFLSALTVVQVLPLAAIAMVHQQAPARGPALGSGTVEVLVIALLVGVAAVATGLLVSSWASTSEKAMTALPVILIAQLALAGPWAEGKGPFLDVLRHMVPARWAAAAVSATILGDASGWWVSVLWLAGLIVLQLAAALALLRHTTPSREAGGQHRLDAAGTRLGSLHPAGIRFVPIGLALVLAVAAGAGALGRADDTSPSAGAMSRPAAAASDAAAAPAAVGPEAGPTPPDPVVTAGPLPVEVAAGPAATPPAPAPNAPPPAEPQSRKLAAVASAPPAPATTVVAGPQPSPRPAAPPTPTTAPRPTATYSTSGGVVRVACSGFFIELLSAVPSNGYAKQVISAGPGNVDVRFVRSGQELSVKAICYGQPIRYYEQTPPRQTSG